MILAKILCLNSVENVVKIKFLSRKFIFLITKFNNCYRALFCVFSEICLKKGCRLIRGSLRYIQLILLIPRGIKRIKINSVSDFPFTGKLPVDFVYDEGKAVAVIIINFAADN